MLAFDAPTRETCTARRQRTNTPLQALTMMNDPIFIEASRTLAEELIARGNISTTQQITEAFRRITGRRPRPSDVELLAELHGDLLQEFEDDPDAARSFRQVGQSTVRGELDPAQHASLAFVISLIFDLTETIVPR